jgi:regulatory protein
MPLHPPADHPTDPNELLEKCRESALRLLEQRMHSRAELDRKLRDRDYPQNVRTAILADLERVNLIDDRLFAETFMRQKFESGRPVGARRVLQDLARRGIDRELAQEVLDAYEEERGDEGEFERAADAARGKWASLMRSGRDYQKARASVARFLAGRGFGSSVIWRVIDDLEPPDPSI